MLQFIFLFYGIVCYCSTLIMLLTSSQDVLGLFSIRCICRKKKKKSNFLVVFSECIRERQRCSFAKFVLQYSLIHNLRWCLIPVYQLLSKVTGNCVKLQLTFTSLSSGSYSIGIKRVSNNQLFCFLLGVSTSFSDSMDRVLCSPEPTTDELGGLPG